MDKSNSLFLRDDYTHKNTNVDRIFDFSFLLYFFTYLTFYNSDGTLGRLRLISTVFLILSGWLELITTSPKGNINIRNSGYIIWYSCFIAFSFLSVIWAYDSNKINITNMIRIILLGLFISVRIKSEKDITRLCTLFVLAAACRFVYVLNLMLNYYGKELLFLRRFGDQFHYNSNENAFISSLCITFLVFCFNKCKRIQRTICFAFILFFSFILLLSGSKKGFISIILVISIYGQLEAKGEKRITRLCLSFIGIVVLYEMLTNIPFFYQIIGYRIENMLSTVFMHSESDTSTGNRIKLIQEGIDIWLQHPILGAGLNNFSSLQDIGGDNYYSHCNFIELLADLGIVGFIIYYGFLLWLIKQKVDTDLSKIIKSIVVSIVILDFGTISYQQFYLHFFYIILSVIVFEKKNIESCKKTEVIIN